MRSEAGRHETSNESPETGGGFKMGEVLGSDLEVVEKRVRGRDKKRPEKVRRPKLSRKDEVKRREEKAPQIEEDREEVLEPTVTPTPDALPEDKIEPSTLQSVEAEAKTETPPVSVAPESPSSVVAPEIEEDIAGPELNPYSKRHAAAVESITAQYAIENEIDKADKETIREFLADEQKRVQKEFALEWFAKNRTRITKEIGNIADDDPEKNKIEAVLNSKEVGGMEAGGDINKPEYKEFQEEADVLASLAEEMEKKRPSLMVPFLVLNRLRQHADKERERATSPEEQKKLEDLESVMKNLAEKATGENLTERAEKLAGEKPGEEKDWVEKRLEAKRIEVFDKRAEELIDKEWNAFLNLPEKKKKKIQKELGVQLEVSRKFFDEVMRNNEVSLGLWDRNYRDYNYGEFRHAFKGAILKSALENGISGSAFYGLLEKGYKPYEKLKRTGFFGRGIIMMREAGPTKEMSKEEYDKLVKDSKDEHIKAIDLQAKKELKETWKRANEEYDRRVKNNIVERVRDIAALPERGKDGIKERHKEAVARRVQEFREDYLKKQAAEAEKPVIRQEVELKPEKPKSATVNLFEFFSDVLADEQGRRKGGLEGLTGDLKKDADVLSRYFAKMGIREMTPGKIRKILGDKRGGDIYKKQWGNRDGLADWFLEIIKDRPWEGVQEIKK